MYKSFLFIFIAIISITCNQTQPIDNNDTKPIDLLEDSTELLSEDVPEKRMARINTLMATFYRIIDSEDPTSRLNENWFELFKKDGAFFMERTNHTIVEGIDECTGDSLKTIITERNTILLIEPSFLTSGKVIASITNKDDFFLYKSFELFFDDKKYKFRTEGIQSDSNIKNFKLFLKVNEGKEELLLEEKELEDSSVKLLFAGDIDRDGKLDLILDAPRHYEEKRMLLFLSSKATEGNLLQNVSETRSGFDC